MPGTLPIRRFDAVICDVDGCLSPEGNEPFDVEGLLQIAEYNRAAVRDGDRPLVTLCTGRPQPFAEAMCRLIQNMDLPCVCENGAYSYHAGSNKYELDPAITPGHLEAVGELSRWAARRYGLDGFTQQPGKTASVTLYHPQTERLREIMPAIVEECRERRWPFRVSMTWFYINCDLEHIDKGSGLDRMLGALKFDKSRLAGIGDTPSDRPIAQRVAFFACPSNASPAIKEHAHFVASKPEVHGVLEILQRLIEVR